MLREICLERPETTDSVGVCHAAGRAHSIGLGLGTSIRPHQCDDPFGGVANVEQKAVTCAGKLESHTPGCLVAGFESAGERNRVRQGVRNGINILHASAPTVRHDDTELGYT